MKFVFPPESTPLPGFTIKRAIQKGGFGEVYYALSDAGKEVALKLLQNNTDIEIRGTQQCLNLKHPNLVTIFDIRTDADDDTWIVMEYITGRTLDRILAEQHPQGMPPEEARWWLAGIAAGVGYLHDRGIVHRDLKPANLYREAGLVKVGDVGLSKMITPSQRGAQTESIGTVYYMAPEVGRGQYGQEVDVYSTGVVLYELLTGRVPFDGETTAEILMKHLSEEPDLSPLPARLRPVLERALAKDPDKRTGSLGQLLAEFDAAMGGRPLSEPPPAPAPAAAPEATPPESPPTEKPLSPVTRPGSQPLYPTPTPLDPLTVRRISLPRRLLEMTAGMAAAIPFTAVLAAGAWLTGFFNPDEGAFGNRGDALTAVSFGLTTLLAAWGLLGTTKAWEGTGPQSLHLRRFSLACLGGGIGAAAWWLHRVLLVDLPFDVAGQGAPLIKTSGVWKLVSGNNPTLAGYMVFFALLFGVRRWYWHTDAFRPRRLRILSLLLTLLVARMLAQMLGFPISYALGLALGISCVVQLASPWVPPQRRPGYLAVHAHE